MEEAASDRREWFLDGRLPMTLIHQNKIDNYNLPAVTSYVFKHSPETEINLYVKLIY